MKRGLFIAFACLLFGFPVFAQEKIGYNVYSYGNLENSVKGKILVHYMFDDPRGEREILKQFNKKKLNVVSWNSLFLPGQSYSETQIRERIEKEDIETIILVRMKGKSTYSKTSSKTGFIPSESYIKSVSLAFEIFSKASGFDKPVAVIDGRAENNFGSDGSSQHWVSMAVVKRILNAMKKEGAF